MSAGPYYFRGFHVQPHLVESLQRYVQQGVPLGDFLRCVVENDLKEACGRADGVNISQLPAFVAYMVNEMPLPSQGSPAKYLAWCAHRGLDGAENMQHTGGAS